MKMPVRILLILRCAALSVSFILFVLSIIIVHFPRMLCTTCDQTSTIINGIKSLCNS